MLQTPAQAMRSGVLNLCDSDNVVVAQVVTSSTSRSDRSSGWETQAQLEVLAIAQGPPVVSLRLRADGGWMGGSYRSSEHSPLLVHQFRYLLFLFERDDSEHPYIAQFEFLPGTVPVPNDLEFRAFWRKACATHNNRIYSFIDVLNSIQPMQVPMSMQPLATALIEDYRMRKAQVTPPSPEQVAEALKKRQMLSREVEQPVGGSDQPDRSSNGSP